MTIFENCHIFLKMVIFAKYEKKKPTDWSHKISSNWVGQKAYFRQDALVWH